MSDQNAVGSSEDLTDPAPIIIQIDNVVLIVSEQGLDILVEAEDANDTKKLELEASEAHALMHAVVGLSAMAKNTGDIW